LLGCGKNIEDGRRPGVTHDEHAELVELRREFISVYRPIKTTR
jgi:hypothetical protein